VIELTIFDQIKEAMRLLARKVKSRIEADPAKKALTEQQAIAWARDFVTSRCEDVSAAGLAVQSVHLSPAGATVVFLLADGSVTTVVRDDMENGAQLGSLTRTHV
jgi:hypothetical protein